MPHQVLVAHGSPDPRHAAVLRSVVAALPAYGVRAELAFLEFDHPRAQHVVATARGGAVLVTGLLLAPGYHAREDIPRLAAEPGVVDGGTLGAGSWLFGVLDELVASVGGDGESGVVLVTAGSSRVEARTHLTDFARRWAGTRVGPVRVLTPDGLAASAWDGEDVVIPLLLAPGVLSDRVAEIAGRLGLRCTSVLAVSPGFVAALAARLDGAPSTLAAPGA